jgi:dTDP-4-amino-4,6-dideoxygalactose transaminase
MTDLAIDDGDPIRTEPFPEWPVFEEAEIDRIAEILRSGETHSGSSAVVREFEEAFAEWNGVEHAVTCNSGTSALHVALAAVGVGPGDEVIVPPRSYVSSASAVVYQDAVPVFADIDPDTHNLDPESVREGVSEHTAAILPVHIAGNPCEMDAILDIADEHGLAVVEDCAQAHGATYEGAAVGTFGDVNAYSFQNSKILTTAGDGGMVTTDDDDLAEFCREFRHMGFPAHHDYDQLDIYQHNRLGYNYRMTPLNAAVGLSALDRVDGYIETRRENAAALDAGLADIEGVTPMQVTEGGRCTYYWYYGTVAVEEFAVDRDRFIEAVAAEGVNARVGTGAELYTTAFFREKDALAWDERLYDGDVSYEGTVCPTAHEVGKRSFALAVEPPADTEDMADTVAAVEKVADAYRR